MSVILFIAIFFLIIKIKFAGIVNFSFTGFVKKFYKKKIVQ